MNDPFVVRRAQSLGSLMADVHGLHQRKASSVFPQANMQRDAVQVLHHQIWRAAFLPTQVDDANQVGMADDGDGACFVDEAQSDFSVLGDLGVQELDGDSFAAVLVFAFVHHAHAACGKPTTDDEVLDLGPLQSWLFLAVG